MELAGGIVRYVPLHPPAGSDAAVISGNEWTIDMEELASIVSPRTKMLISLCKQAGILHEPDSYD